MSHYNKLFLFLEKFSQNVPMNPVRALYERCPTAKFHLLVFSGFTFLKIKIKLNLGY